MTRSHAQHRSTRVLKLSRMTIAIWLALSGSERARAQLTADPDATTTLVVAGGVSLGSYQAGFLYYYSEYLKAEQIKLAAVTGASAGAINATIAAIESCRTPQSDPTQSPYWKVWIPVGLDELLPADGSSVTRLGLLQRAPLEKAAGYLQRYIERQNATAEAAQWTSGECRVPIGIVATRLAPESVAMPVAAQRATERFGVVFDKDAEGRLSHITDCELAPPATLVRGEEAGCTRNEQFIRHPGSNNEPHGRPMFGDLRNLLFASSSFPLAFEPRPLTSHEHVGAGATTDIYVDGGVFDNIPIAFAQALMPERDGTLVVVDSDNTPWKPTEQPASTYASIIDAAGAFTRGFVGAARTRELLQLKGDVRYPERRAMLTSDYLFAFSGFLDQHFREFDFYLGMLDARNFVRRSASDGSRVDAFEHDRIKSAAFTCFERLETASLGFSQVPDRDQSVALCLGAAQSDKPSVPDAKTQKLLDLIGLFEASVATQRFATSATRPSQLDVFQHFLGVLQDRGFEFSLHGDTFPAEDLIYQLRRASGAALGQLANKQPEYSSTMHLLTDIALDLALFHILPDFYWSAGVHLNRGVDLDASWGLGQTNVARIGVGFRLRRFSVLEEPAAGTPSVNFVGSHSLELSRSFSLDFGAEVGLGYRFGAGPRDELGHVAPYDAAGARQVVALSAAAVGYDTIYLRLDARVYSRMSRHWPTDYRELELGGGIGWRFH